ncbi:uncharacterized protein LOC109855523 [Pseudomyrmex gracilis]|uniref:uncharacterized protein LOC109855523 n=1 Tax=Pseudomyrmex gracilis TaxID=219809 RepID=UPI0009950965|nr:uncharacterized protein LOC109855523 [Pseudomyrmex gracilis]
MEHPSVNCKFIKEDLIPDMVHNRYFCEPNSREFIELDFVTAEHFDNCTETSSPYYKKRVRFHHLSTCAEVHQVMADLLFSDKKKSFALIVKLHKRTSPPFDGFENEEMFYTKMSEMLQFGTDITPKCYLSDMRRYKQPIVVLEDLTARGYASIDAGELDENHLKVCVKTLATFHGRGMKLRASQSSVFNEFRTNFWSSLETTIEIDALFQKHIEEEKKIIENKLGSSSASSVLLEKTYKKMLKINSLVDEVTDVSTICHGHFLGDNVLFGYENGMPNDAKIMDWEQLRFSTPAVDFGTVLMANLPNETVPVLEKFCRDILQFYIDVVKTEYPEVNCELLERDILAKLLIGYFISRYLMGTNNDGCGGTLKILELLYSLGSLD